MSETASTTPLEWTGERLVTTCHRPIVFEHLHRYAIACTLADGKRVLDIACGEGYGANLLARTATKVTGIDIDERTIAHARAAYPHRNLEFMVGDCTAIPCPDDSFDLIASFETIEHIADHERFIAEIKRVLAPGGVVIISSPDKAEYRAVSGGAANPFHQDELTHEQFIRLMTESFEHCVAGRQRLVVGSWIGADAPDPGIATGTFHGGFNGVTMEPGVAHGVYSIAACSDAPLPVVTLGLFEEPTVTREIWHLLDDEQTPGQRAQELAGTRQQLAASTEAFEEKARHITILQGELEEKARHVAVLQRELEEKARHVAVLQRELEEKTQQVTHYQGQASHFEEESKRLHFDSQLAQEKLARITNDLSEARWELLTFRGNAMGGNYSHDVTAATLDTINRAEVAESQRDSLRAMIGQLQGELENVREALDSTSYKLQLFESRVQLLVNSPANKLILPFSSPHRKLRRLTKALNGA